MSDFSNLSVSGKKEQAIANKLGDVRNFEKYRQGSAFTLEPLYSFLERVHNPEKKLSGIQVLGTNGKGSAAFYLAWVFSYREKVGLFTSPHAFSYRERIACLKKGKVSFISYALLLRILETINEKSRKSQIRLSPFEKLTVASYLFFAQEKVRFVVLEAGLGGRLDATSTFHPDLHLFTPIAADHTALLGRRLQQIAKEKAEAIKPHTQVYTFPQKRSVMRMLEKVAQARRCRLSILPTPSPMAKGSIKKLSFSLFACNAVSFLFPSFSLALASSCCAAHHVYFWETGEVHLPNSSLPLPPIGRRTVLRSNPPLLFDGAHNPAAIRALAEEVKTAFPDLKWQVVFGCLKDKEYQAMLLPLVKIAATFCLPALPPPFLSNRTLHQFLSNCGAESTLAHSVSCSALQPVLVTGSFRLSQLLPSLGKKRVKVVPAPFSE